jgi:hypothetical protein
MKKYFFLLAALAVGVLKSYAQSIAINNDGSKPDPNAIVDVKSTTKGVLLPRMTTAERHAIPNTKGLLLYDTDDSLYFYNDGASWQSFFTASLFKKNGEAWLLTGNSQTKDKTNFVGTKDDVPLNFRVNNQPSGRIDHKRQNSYWGYEAGKADSSGSNNTANGYRALYSNKIGFSNVAIGGGALFSSSSASNTIAIGDSALFHFAIKTQDFLSNIALGSKALYSNTSGTSNSAVGFQALFSNKSGVQNEAHGNQALYSNTTGDLNVAVGFEALFSNTTGGTNTALGASAMFYNTTGYNNTAVGTGALSYNTTGYYNTSTGFLNLGDNTTGHDNTSNGHSAMIENITGNFNTATGSNSLEGNLVGNWNTANGAAALQQSNGYSNTANGYEALGTQTNGSNNTGDGAYALISNKTGFNITALGANTDVSVDGLLNATVIGFGAQVDASNKVRIGNADVTIIEGQVPFTTPSDGRFKFNIQENVRGLDFILKLRPVTYQFDVKKQESFTRGAIAPGQLNNYISSAGNDEATQMIRTGFIAQEVEQAAKKAGYDFDGVKAPRTENEYYSLSYSSFVVPLVKAMQEQQQIISKQQQKLEEQNIRIDNLESELAEIMKNQKSPN